MANPKGNVATLTNAGKGRPKNSKNKTPNLKEVIMETFVEIGGKKALKKWIDEKPRHRELFYSTMVVKLLPKDMNLGGQLFDGLAERMLEARNRQKMLEEQCKLEHRPILEINNQGKLIEGATSLLTAGSVIESIEAEDKEEVKAEK